METPTRQSLVASFDAKTLAALEGLDFKARYLVEGFLQGMHRSPFHGFSVEFSDYRDYQPGDDLRHLDWRLYARTDRLCIKRYMQETNVRFYLVCDTSASMSYRGSQAWGSKLDCARVLALAITWFLLRQNDAVGIVSLSGDSDIPQVVRPAQRPTQFGLILSRMESLKASGGACLDRLLDHAARLIHPRSVVLLFSDLLEPAESLTSGLKHLRFDGHEVLVFQVLDRDEVEFPFQEPKIFRDLETGMRRQISPGQARAPYLAKFRAFMEAHLKQLQSLEMSHCLVRTDANPLHALAHFLAERKRLL